MCCTFDLVIFSQTVALYLDKDYWQKIQNFNFINLFVFFVQTFFVNILTFYTYTHMIRHADYSSES